MIGLKNKIKVSLFIVIFFVVLSVVIIHGSYIKNIDINLIIGLIENGGIISVLIYITLFAIKPILIIIPASIFSLAAGIVFGSFKAFVLTMIGFFISGSVAFYLSRVLGRDLILKILGKRMITINEGLQRDGFKVIFLLRLPPILPYDPLSYACGFTKVTYKDFILASLIGVIPETLCYSILGKNFMRPLSLGFAIPLSIIIIATIIASKRYKKDKSL